MTHKVLLVDDHKIISDGMHIFIESIEGFEVVGWANTLADAKVKIEQLRPDLVMLDNRLPDGEGIDIIPKLVHDYPEMKIIVLTSFEDSNMVIKAIGAGAQGYLTKNVKEDYMKYILQNVMQDEQTWLDPSLTTNFIMSLGSDFERVDKTLTKDERFLVSLIAQGKTNKEIADHLFISEHTIKKQLSKIYKKIGMTNRYDVALYAIKHNIVM